MPFAPTHTEHTTPFSQHILLFRLRSLCSNITPQHPIKSLCFLNRPFKLITCGRRKAPSKGLRGCHERPTDVSDMHRVEGIVCKGAIHVLSIKIKTE
ncbi:hypothetical protein TNIN_65951 [Trichonephila inaurata madagascariensis]|nr:hypothetical protein TNIN_65951 [Trichonephila inaurata madagascariensis]